MYEQFSEMLGESVRTTIEDFKAKGDELSGGDDSFGSGYWMCLHRIFTLMEQAADIYEIPMSAIGLDGLTEESFLGQQ